jgi:hypothetical protein
MAPAPSLPRETRDRIRPYDSKPSVALGHVTASALEIRSDYRGRECAKQFVRLCYGRAA